MGGAYLQNITGGAGSTMCTSVYNWALYCQCKWLCRKLFKSVQRVYEIGITGSMGPQTPVKMITMSWRRLPGGGYCATHIVHYDHSPLDLNDSLIFVAMQWQCHVNGLCVDEIIFSLNNKDWCLWGYNTIKCNCIWWSPTISRTMQSLRFFAQVLWPPWPPWISKQLQLVATMTIMAIYMYIIHFDYYIHHE